MEIAKVQEGFFTGKEIDGDGKCHFRVLTIFLTHAKETESDSFGTKRKIL